MERIVDAFEVTGFVGECIQILFARHQVAREPLDAKKIKRTNLFA